MTLSDQEFREEYKPLQIPANYSRKDTLNNKIIYALAQLGEGNTDRVVAHLKELEPAIENDNLLKSTEDFLRDMFEKGLIKGAEIEGSMVYNLSKITQVNKGTVDPDMLAPGLD